MASMIREASRALLKMITLYFIWLPLPPGQALAERYVYFHSIPRQPPPRESPHTPVNSRIFGLTPTRCPLFYAMLQLTFFYHLSSVLPPKRRVAPISSAAVITPEYRYYIY